MGGPPPGGARTCIKSGEVCLCCFVYRASAIVRHRRARLAAEAAEVAADAADVIDGCSAAPPSTHPPVDCRPTTSFSTSAVLPVSTNLSVHHPRPHHPPPPRFFGLVVFFWFWLVGFLLGGVEVSFEVSCLRRRRACTFVAAFACLSSVRVRSGREGVRDALVVSGIRFPAAISFSTLVVSCS